MRSGVIFAA